MKVDAVAVGECLIDFMPWGWSPSGEPMLERSPGGAPVNVMAALARLGNRTAFIGKVGDDPFGHYLLQAVEGFGVCSEGMVLTKEAHTTLAFVHLDGKGERTFHFCRHPGADQMLTYAEVDQALLRGTRIFHFGSVSMTDEPSRSATLQSAAQAKEHGALITYDPNWRPALWRGDGHAAATIRDGLKLADVVKVSEEELAFLAGTARLEEGAERLMENYPMALLLVTLGEKGTWYKTGCFQGLVSSFAVNTIDTTGAGDGFFGAFLNRLLELGTDIRQWNEDTLRNAIRFANASGALATTRMGAIPSFAGMAEIECLIGAKHGQ